MKRPYDRADRLDTAICALAATIVVVFIVTPFAFAAWVIHHVVWSIWP